MGANGRVTQAEVNALRDGLSQSLVAIENSLVDEVFGETLPLVGNNFQEAWTNRVDGFRYLTKLRGAILSGLAGLTNQADYAPTDLSTPINSRLSSSNFISSTVVVTTVNDEAQLAFTTSDTFTAGNVPVESNFGVPNLDLRLTTTNNAQTTTAWTFNFGVGVDGAGFYLETGGSAFSVNTTTTANSLNASGRFTRLPYTITDNNTSGATRTSIPANFAIALRDPDNGGKIRLNELSNSGALVDATLTGSTRLSLKLLSSIPATAMLPQVGTDLTLLWTFSSAQVDPTDNNSSFGNRPLLSLDNNRINLHSFFNGFAGRALRQIDDTTEPLQPVIDVLTTVIPLLSDLGSDQLTILDLFGVSPETVDAIGGLAALLDLANAASAYSGNQNVFTDLGGYTLQSGDVRVQTLDEIPGSEARPPSSTRDADLNAFMAEASGINGLQFPLLTDASVIGHLLLGRNTTLFSYRSGEIGFDEQLGPLFFPVLGPVGITLGGNIGMKTEFGFGYDTQGIFDFSAGGGTNPDLLFNGFYAMSLDENLGPLTGIELSFGVTAGVEANIVVASVGVEGDITATVGIYLDDILGDAQGRIRGNTLTSLPVDDLFYAAGSVSAGLRAYLEVGFPPFSVSFDFDSPRVTLISFDSRDTTTPVLATETLGNQLTLNVGDRAPLRIHGDNDDRAEEFFVGNSAGGGLSVFAFNEQMDFPLPLLVVADANLRGDVITTAADMNVPVRFNGGPGRDILSGGGGADVLEGGDGPDRLGGRTGDDTLRGGDDNDELNGGGGSDLLDGGPGLDTASWVGSQIPLTMDLRTFTFGGAAVGDTLVSIERYAGTTLDDTMDGSEGDDSLLRGESGNDTIRGHGGSDQLEGGDGADMVDGGEGDDLINGGHGADFLDGGPGIDILSYLGAESPVTVSLLTSSGSRGEAAGDTLANFEILMGSGLPKELGPIPLSGDILEGSDLADRIYGMDGADALFGAGGNDILYGNHPDSPGSMLPGFDADELHGGAGNDMLFGQTDDDDLDGDEGMDTLDGGDGNDHLITTDLLYPDLLDGGTGTNRLSANYSDKTNAFFFVVGTNNTFAFPDGDTFTNIQTLGTLTLGDGNDVVRLAARQEHVRYNKTINTGAGDDFVFADWRGQYLSGQSLLRTADSVNGGEGNDTLSFEQSTGGVTANLATGGLGGHAAGMTMTGFENLIGTDFIDNLTGDTNDNILNPMATRPNLAGPGSNDYVQGGNGNDTLRVDFSKLPEANAVGISMTGNFTSGYENITLGPNYSPANASALVYYLSIERFEITGSQTNDVIIGETVNFAGGENQDRFFGMGGNDYLDGSLDDDYLDGGEGNDTLVLGAGNDTAIGGSGNDTITFSYADNSFSGYGADTVYAGPGDDSVTSIASAGNDTTSANASTVIKFDGGPGVDTLRVDVGHMTSPFVFDENNPPSEILLPNGGYLRNFERLSAITTGSGNDVVVLAGRVNNQIALRGGNDILDPGLGIDTVNAGSGGDDLVILDYSLGEDPDIGAVTNNISGWPVRNRISDGAVVDQINITTFERVRFTGSSKADFFIGRDGNDQIFGGAGNDLLRGANGNDWIDGGTGADNLEGGNQNDTYIVDDPGDTVVEAGGSGNDHVRSAVDFTLPVNVEMLTLTGSAINGTGNSASNAITGNSQNNYLRGEGGNDLLNGGGGAGEIDRLHGGANADTFVLGDAGGRFYDDANPTTPGHSGYAIIEDFTPSQSDRLRLAGLASHYFLGTSPIVGVPGSAIYHDSNTNSVFEPATDELIAVLVSPEVLTTANTLSNANYSQAVDPATIGLTAPLRAGLTNDGSGLRLTVEFSIFDPLPAGVLVEIQASNDLGFGEPWLTIASKTGPAAWTGAATVHVGPPANGRVTISVTDIQPTSQTPQRFFRMKLSNP